MGKKNFSDYIIATLGSHSALQILKGARDEGMRNLVICMEGKERPYKSFGVADEIITVNTWADFWGLEEELIKRNVIMVPHGSFVAYLGADRVGSMRMMQYGSKAILKWESDRHLEREWLERAGLLLPRILEKPEDIDRAA